MITIDDDIVPVVIFVGGSLRLRVERREGDPFAHLLTTTGEKRVVYKKESIYKKRI